MAIAVDSYVQNDAENYIGWYDRDFYFLLTFRDLTFTSLSRPWFTCSVLLKQVWVSLSSLLPVHLIRESKM